VWKGGEKEKGLPFFFRVKKRVNLPAGERFRREKKREFFIKGTKEGNQHQAGCWGDKREFLERILSLEKGF